MAQSSFVETHHSKWWLLQTPVASMDSFCVVSRSFPWQIHQSSTKTMNLDVLLKKDCILPWFLCTKRSVLDKPQLNFTKKKTLIEPEILSIQVQKRLFSQKCIKNRQLQFATCRTVTCISKCQNAGFLLVCSSLLRCPSCWVSLSRHVWHQSTVSLRY